MEKELVESIESRCESELLRNDEYIKLQTELADAHRFNDIETFSRVSFRMQCIATVTGYKVATKDLFSMIRE